MAVLAPIVYVCRHHAGDVVENHFQLNAAEITQLGSFFRFRRLELCPLFPRGLDVPVPMGWNIPGMLVLGLIIAPGWREAPSFLKRTLPTMFVPLLGLMLVLGIWSELRAIRELLPIVLLLLYAGLRSLWRPRVPFP
jgi:hypothetical protein